MIPPLLNQFQRSLQRHLRRPLQHHSRHWIRYFILLPCLAVLTACVVIVTDTSPPLTSQRSQAQPSPTSQQARVSNSSALVDIKRVNAQIRVDIRYATKNNFTHRPLYAQARCLLRPAVAARLSRVQTDLAVKGIGLKVYDCYRPLSVQKQMWKLVPDDRYVANPAQGSRHNRGSAVDLTLVDRDGNELEMPTSFDDFSDRAHVDYPRVSQSARQHRAILQQAMKRQGFAPLQTEWWHFDDPSWRQYPLLDVPLDGV